MDRAETSALLRQARTGTPEALERLYERVGGKLLALIRIRLGRDLRAHLESGDILQATLLKSFAHLDEFEGDQTASLMGWLARIAEHEIRDRVDYFRRGRRDRACEVPLEEGTALAVTGARSALTQLALNEEIGRLEAALETLDPPYREVIVLRGLQELTFREVSARMARSEDACRMLYARAMAALTLRMQDVS